MKKVLWIACLLCMMPFLGYAQNHAGLAMQDDEEVFGQAPVSNELPSVIRLNIERNRDDVSNVWAHVMYVPPQTHTFGRYYEVSLIDGENAQITQRQMYNNWYYSSAEYYSGMGTDYPVWAFAEDYVQGFMNLTYVEGNPNTFNTPISLSMNDIAYDYRGDRMLGVKYGRIYKIELDGDRPGTSELLYDYADHDNLKPITIAVDLDGTVYFVSTSVDGTDNSLLYKFEYDEELGMADLESDPVEVGDLGWPARKIQTMAFNHKTRELFWWACDQEGNSQLKRVNKETAECENKTDLLTTEMAGLIFEFDYRPYNVTCINEEGTLLLDENSEDDTHTFNLTTSGYYPAKDVEFFVEAPDCNSIDSVVVMFAGAEEDDEITEDEIIAVYHTEDLVYVPATGTKPTGYETYAPGYYGSFVMPADDVEIDAFWIGNEHEVNLVWTPASLTDALTMDGTTALCGEEVFVTYAHPEGYYLKNVVAICGEGDDAVELEVTVHSDDSQISFEMCDDVVTVTATYVTTTLTQIQDICQWNTLKKVPNASHSLGLGHKHIYTFTDPNGEEHVFGDGVMNNNQVDALLGAYEFEVAGQWAYTTIFVSATYGNFTSVTKYFYVHAAPHSIAIQEEYEIEGEPDLIYNAHYNCDGDSIHLEVITPDDPDYEFNGTFTWTKDGEEIATTTEPLLVINPCSKPDAGIYNVTYVPTSSAEATTATDAPCSFDLGPNGFPVNVSSLPNDPPIDFVEGSNPICYNSPATLHWVHGDLNPEEYTCVWYLIIDEEWVKITEENLDTIDEYDYENFMIEDDVLVTDNLKADATFGLSIYYRGVNNLCHAESEPFTVEVKETVELEILGDTATCLGFVPAVNPYVEGEFTDFVWKWDLEEIEGVEGNELVFEDNAQLGELIQEAGKHVIDVEAIDADGCVIYGTMDFFVNELPDVALANNITDEIAHPDHLVTIEVCAGDYVELTASGADEYRWGDAKDGGTTVESTMTLQPLNSMTYSVSGKNEETGCWNTTSIRINVNPLPVITWVNPANNYTFSMMQTNFPLVANVEGVGDNPEGGIFTYIIEGDPNEINWPIEDENGNPTNIFNPAQVGIGEYKLVYSYQNANGCQSEAMINITIEKPYWTDIDKRNNFWYEDCLEAKRFEITSNEDLGAFAAYLNYNNLEPEDQEGIFFYDFAEDTVWITNNIDLLYDYNWLPDELTFDTVEQFYFYRPLNEFQGVLDGTGKVVTNMTILEDELEMNINGFIRNIGVKDANITSTFAPCVVDVLEGARLHNSYITMPTLNNVTPNFRPSGEVRNVYYYGPMPEAKAVAAIYVDNAAEPAVVITPIDPETLLHGPEPFTGILEEWVWIQNDWAYRDWIVDAEGNNYGYPMLNEQFIHHHYVSAIDCEISEHELQGVSTRTINDVDYVYAMAGDEITVNYTPESDYVIIDSIKVYCHDYYTDFGTSIDSTFVVEGPALSFTFTMPVDSLYLPAYELEIEPYCRRDYWTDEGNYDPEWFDHITSQDLPFDVHTNAELAAVAYMCDFGGYDFEGDTIHIVGSENAEDEDPCRQLIIDMTGHYWRPIYNFKGVIDGTRYIVENLFIREDISAMFVDCEGGIQNFGIKDIDLPEEGESAIYVYNTSDDMNAFVRNSFATINPELHQQYPIAVGEGVVVENTYTLDEGGNMIDHEGNGIDIAALNAWVAEQSVENPLIYWDWKLDECPMNYGYPIHNQQYDGGWLITYDPDILNPNNGYVTGINEDGENAVTGHTGEIITVTPYPDWCFDLFALTVDYGDSIADILNTKQFEMPDHAVTVHAEFAPKNWKLTVFHKDMNGNTIAPTDTYNLMHYQDEILIADYAVNDPDFEYELITDDETVNQDTEMPCGNKQLTIYYQGKMHDITICENETEYEVEITTDPEDEARYTETVTVTIEAQDGVSITGLEILDAEGNPVAYTSTTYGTYTFTMPSSDVTICPAFDEEYWDDYMIADPSWFFIDPTATTYELTTDSMLGGLAALVTGRQWLLEHWTEFEHPEGYELTEEALAGLDFNGVTIVLNSEQEEGEINLIEHKWRPIGAQIEFLKQFNGTFDGNGQIITNMRTTHLFNYNDERDGACQGLFGTVGVNGIVNDVNIQGYAEGRYFTAGVAAVNYGIIMNCVADVDVKSEFQAGGIVCNNFSTGYVLNSYCISDMIECISAAPAKDNPTNNYYVGGVASYNEGVITNCHSVATLVKGNGNNPINYYGGVVGMNQGEVSNSYWTGSWPCVGGGVDATDCAKINNTTYNLMTATAQDLNSVLDLSFDLYLWINSTTNPKYPVFDLTSRSTMTISENDFNVSIYPNPTKGDVKIASDNIQRVAVYNMFGQMILETEANGNETMINLSGCAAGVYMVKVTTSNGVATRNIIVE